MYHYMSNEPKYERLNTVAGLVAKHKELSDLRERYRVEQRNRPWT